MKVKTLRQKHPTYDGPALERFEALYAGGREWRERVEWWIPQNAQEPIALWKERKDRAVYINHAGPILDLIAAWLFTEDPTVGGLDEAWVANCDGQGTPWATWWKGVFLDALRDDRSFVWVNMPARPDGVELRSLADQEALGLNRPFLVKLEAEAVLDWWQNAAGELTAVLMEHEISERAGVGDERSSRVEWTFIDQAVIRRWEWRATPDRTEPGDDDEATELPEVQHGFGRLPVVRLALPCGLHAMGKLEDAVTALTRSENDLDWALHRGAHALMVLQTEDGVSPTLGPGYYLQVGVQDRVGYAEPTGACYAALETRIGKRREDVYAVVQQMAAGVASNQQAAQRSAAAKSMDWQTLEVMLDAYGELVRPAMAAAARIAGVPLKAGEIAVGGLEGWGQEDLTTFLQQAAEALGLVKSETFRREVARVAARRALPDAKPEVARAIDAEIDAADYEEAPLYQPPPGKKPAASDPGGGA